MHKPCGGKVPKLYEEMMDDKDRQIIADIKAAKEKVENLIEQYNSAMPCLK